MLKMGVSADSMPAVVSRHSPLEEATIGSGGKVVDTNAVQMLLMIEVCQAGANTKVEVEAATQNVGRKTPQLQQQSRAKKNTTR